MGRKRREKRDSLEAEKGPWKYAANVLIFLVVSIYLYDIFNYTEHWPFSSHRMYSTLIPDTYVRNELMMVTPDGEIPPDVNVYFKPFKKSQFTYMLRHVVHSKNRRLAEEALSSVARAYERNKKEADNDWPELLGLKLYRLQWELDPTLANRDDPARALIFEHKFR